MAGIALLSYCRGRLCSAETLFNVLTVIDVASVLRLVAKMWAATDLPRKDIPNIWAEQGMLSLSGTAIVPGMEAAQSNPSEQKPKRTLLIPP